MIISILSFIFCLALSIISFLLFAYVMTYYCMYMQDYLLSKGCGERFSYNISLTTTLVLMFIGMLATINYFDATSESEYMNKPIKLEKVYVDKNKK